MTILFFDGADWTNANVDLQTKWDTANVGAIGSSWSRWPTGYGVTQIYSQALGKYLTYDTYDTVCIGLSYYIPNSSWNFSLSNPWLVFKDKNGVIQVKVLFTATREIVVYNGADTLLGTSAVVGNEGIWEHLQVKVYVHDTAGTVDIKKNDISILSLSSKDTKYGTSYIDEVRFNGVYGPASWQDDFWITDGEFLGDCRILSLFPDSDETYTDFSPSTGSDHFAMVDEYPPDDDSTYNEASSLNAKDSYGFTPSITGNIKAIAVNHFIKKTGSQGVRVKNLIRSGGSDYNSTEEKVLSSSYANFVTIHETDPDDSNPWTESKITSAEFGLQITGITTTTTT